MSRETRPLFLLRAEAENAKWKRRRDIPISILAWIALVAVILWVASHIISAILILSIAALIAYAISPAVKILQQIMPRFLAILIVYLIVLGGIGFLGYLAINTAAQQTIALAGAVRDLLSPGKQPSSIEKFLTSFGITAAQISTIREQIVAQSENVARNSLPFLQSAIGAIVDIVVIAVLSIYLLIDGSRVVNWTRQNAPITARANFFLDTLQRIAGGYIRSQLILAALVGVLVGLGMEFVFRLPYATFLGVLAFIMAFIPVLGTLISGTICVLIGLSQSWLVAVGVLIYFIIVHVIEGEVVGPRIVGKAVGLHPAISLFALVAGTELFGIWGALFASPIAGILQAVIASFWSEWRLTHPEHFARSSHDSTGQGEETLSSQPADPTELPPP